MISSINPRDQSKIFALTNRTFRTIISLLFLTYPWKFFSSMQVHFSSFVHKGKTVSVTIAIVMHTDNRRDQKYGEYSMQIMKRTHGSE